MLTIDARWGMTQEELATLSPGTPRRDKAISEAIELASRMGCNVNLLTVGRSYKVGPEDSLESVLGRYREGPGVNVFRPSDGGNFVAPEWIGERADGYKGETKRVIGEPSNGSF